MAQAHFDRHPAAHAVADQVRGVDLQRVEQGHDGVGEERGVIGGADRLDRVAEPRQVDGDRPMPTSQRADRGQKRRLGGPQAVEENHRIPAAGFGHGDPADRRAQVMDAQPTAR